MVGKAGESFLSTAQNRTRGGISSNIVNQVIKGYLTVEHYETFEMYVKPSFHCARLVP